MLFVSMTRPESQKLASCSPFAIELRLDLFSCIDEETLRSFLRNSSCPVILTLRRASQGGKFEKSEKERERLIRRLLALSPSFIDLEYDMSVQFLHEILETHAEKVVLSYHNFQKVPADLAEIYTSMQAYKVFSYKIAAMVHSTNDALKMLLFAKKRPKASVICMGEKGAFARVLGPVVGNPVNYACTDAKELTAPGQLSLATLINTYRYQTLNAETAIYGLIGDPVANSRGHLHHNAVFQEKGINAVYVKMTVKPEELAEFILLAKELGIRGLSVTAPLKEAVIPFVDEMDTSAKYIGAVNTLIFKGKRIIGANTDGAGALDAIERKTCVYGKRVVLLGAGGAARGIAYEAKERGADVIVLNRTVARAKKLGMDLGCAAGGVSNMPDRYDILINCTSDCMPIDPEKIQPGTVAMDVVYHSRDTAFLKEASLKGCQLIYGEEMFLNQAVRQTDLWVK